MTGSGVPARPARARVTSEGSGDASARKEARRVVHESLERLPKGPQNMLYYGDNLDVLRRHIKDESVDLVYLDPPFNSNRDYNVIFQEQDGSRAAAQIKAFGDSWRWDQAAAEAYRDTVESGERVADVLKGMRGFLGESDMLAYLAMMAPRLLELRRVLKPHGTLYLHCDPTAGHYLKLILDGVFGHRNYRNEIIWRYRRWPSKQKNFQRMHDLVYRYSKGPDVTWNQTYEPLSEETQKRIKGGKKIVTFFDEHGKKRIRPTEIDSLGVPMSDVWVIPQIVGPTAERLGYPTQKPEALLARIIKASSNPGDVVLDPFCGCGTTVAVAERLQRKWIGIDITHLAIGLIKHRLHNAYGDSARYRVIGEPVSLADAKELARSDPYQFQWWALGLVGARRAEEKKGADQGIDGRLYFHDEPVGGKTKQIIMSVKAGHVTVSHVRDLLGVIGREGAEIGVLLSFEGSTQPMRTEAASAGFYESPWGKHARIQLRTIRELLDGRGVDYPHVTGSNVTYRKAPKAIAADTETLELPIPNQIA